MYIHRGVSMIVQSDHAAFVAAIRADPDNNAQRLVYADYLEEHDEVARAEFIRVQCELAELEQPNRFGILMVECQCGNKGYATGFRLRSIIWKQADCHPCILRRRERE